MVYFFTAKFPEPTIGSPDGDFNVLLNSLRSGLLSVSFIDF